ncbi:MAG: hypothetical protein ACODAJ_07040, partial [Planctomycetota bacterium]
YGVVTALVLCAGTASAAPYDALVLSDNPYAYWRLGEAAGTTAFDAAPAGEAQNGDYARFAPPDGVPTPILPSAPSSSPRPTRGR